MTYGTYGISCRSRFYSDSRTLQGTFGWSRLDGFQLQSETVKEGSRTMNRQILSHALFPHPGFSSAVDMRSTLGGHCLTTGIFSLSEAIHERGCGSFIQAVSLALGEVERCMRY